MPLTDTAIRNAKPKEKHYKLTDGKGMYVLVNQSGKYFRLDYRFGGKRKTLALGVYPDVTLKRTHWSTTTPIRKIFRNAFVNAGLPYFNPHSFRNTLVQLGQEICKTPEHFKAWSQNLGHEKVLTTFLSYGEVACQRQGEIIRDLAMPQKNMSKEANEIAEAIFKRLSKAKVDA